VAVVLLPCSIVTKIVPSQTRKHSASPLDPVALLQELIRFNTSNPPGNERACLAYLAEILGAAGIECRLVAREHERPNLLARVAGEQNTPPLLLYGHVDVVPACAEEWKRPPFGGDLIDDAVWGRGALDMKGGVAMLVSALLRAAEEAPLESDVVLALTSDEERGSHLGAKFLVEEHADFFAGVRYALGEIGGFTEWVGDRRLYPIQVAEKQRCLVRATVRGAGGHPSTVVRGTAAAKLGALLKALDEERLPAHVTPSARRMLTVMADAFPPQDRLALRGLLQERATNLLLRALGKRAAPLDAILHNTASPTVIRGGESSNVIPTELSVELDGRVLPGYGPGDLLRELEDLAGDLAEFELVDEEPPPVADADLTLYPMLADVIRRRDPGSVPIPALLPGYTDARYFARLGIQTYGFLPMRLPREITVDLIHAPDERVPADAIRFGAECVLEAIQRYPTIMAADNT
jgi:acetylornithine deacetylase/succinyl-diaminopimelate desuccinylase-like protein